MMTDVSWKKYSNVLQRLLNSPDLRQRFLEDTDNVMAESELRISDDWAADLKNILFLMSNSQIGFEDKIPRDSATGSPNQDVQRRLSEAERFFMSTINYIRRSALTTSVMSVLVFVVGLALLTTAAVQAIQGAPGVAAIALAASGLGAIAVAFYRSPVQEMRTSAQSMQRSSMVLMSYMLAIDLVIRTRQGQDVREAATQLSGLTSDLVGQLSPSSSVAKFRGSHRSRKFRENSTQSPPPEASAGSSS